MIPSTMDTDGAGVIGDGAAGTTITGIQALQTQRGLETGQVIQQEIIPNILVCLEEHGEVILYLHR
jgi:hypothetical protein